MPVDTKFLEEIMLYLHNFFYARGAVKEGTFSIEDGAIDLPFLVEGQFYRIIGSARNDGVHCYGDALLYDETFSGVVIPMNVPDAFLNLVEEIQIWQSTCGVKIAGTFHSESFGGYSYTRGTSKEGNALSWKDQFGGRLSPYKKVMY